jgi:hypothetical protein
VLEFVVPEKLINFSKGKTDILYKNLGAYSKKTHHRCIMKLIRIMTFRKGITIYYENQLKRINILSGRIFDLFDVKSGGKCDSNRPLNS